MIFTVGHSNQSLEALIALLRMHAIDRVVDVRSAPVSSYTPHFNKIVLEKALPESGIAYTFMGDRLGGRPSDPEFYDARGFVLYGKMARSFAFTQGIERLEKMAEDSVIALMCGEENPAGCHRHLLVSRVLREHGQDVQHIRGTGALESYEQVVAVSRAVDARSDQGDLFASGDEEWKSIRSVSRENPPRDSSGY